MKERKKALKNLQEIYMKDQKQHSGYVFDGRMTLYHDVKLKQFNFT